MSGSATNYRVAADVAQGDAAAPPSRLAVRHATKRFGGAVALDAVDIDAVAGRVLGLLGANGSGKSTLCRIIAGEVAADSGTILLDGLPTLRWSPQRAAASGVVIAHQHPSLAPDLPVWENLFLGRELCGPGGFVDRGAGRRGARERLAALGLEIDVEQPAGWLTAAQQQLVEIARALAKEPRVLILDEPTAALNAVDVARLFGAIRALANAGVAIVFISHRLPEVEEICDGILVLRNGRHVGRWEMSGRLDEQRILRLMTADTEAVDRTETRRVSGDDVLRATDLRAGPAVRGVDLALRRGEIVGLAGLQGQGQEELLEVLGGARPVESGRILHRGEPVDARWPRDMIRRGICLIPNDRHRQGLFMDQSVGENLSYVGVSLEPRPWQLQARRLDRLARAAIERLSIKTRGPQQKVATLSGGNQQKVVIGKWLATAIEVLLLSDPTKGVDVHARAEIHAYLAGLAASGSAVLIYASDVDELLANCDRILVMFEGRVIAGLAGSAMTEEAIMAAAFGTRP